jgi:uncharacterized protein
MKIRSITYFIEPQVPLDEGVFQSAGRFIAEARQAFEQAGMEVQTVRLATTPFPHYAPVLEPGALSQLAQEMEAAAFAHGFNYVSMGPALPEYPGSYGLIPPVLAATKAVFFSGMMASPTGGIDLPAVRLCADVIQKAAGIEPDGFANLRFTASANVQPGSPFFPAAYHAGGPPIFSLATEAADLPVEAFQSAGSLEGARQMLISMVEDIAGKLTSTADELARRSGVTFGGIDFSLAPFPEDALSLGTAMEALGAPAVGLHGSLAAAAILAEAVDRASFARTGFSGLMLPVLEDSSLAARAAEGLLSVTDLLLYSAVCGTGLDTLPLPGDTSAEELAALLLDVAALSQRLAKPLTARLMPIPGKSAGDPTDFDFAFFANSRVMALKASPLKGFFRGDEKFALIQRGTALSS